MSLGDQAGIHMVGVCPLFLSPVIIHPHVCCLWGCRSTAWRVLGKGGEAQPLAGDPAPQKGSEWS